MWLVLCVKFLWLYPSDERLLLLISFYRSEFQNLFVVASACGPDRSRAGGT